MEEKELKRHLSAVWLIAFVIVVTISVIGTILRSRGLLGFISDGAIFAYGVINEVLIGKGKDTIIFAIILGIIDVLVISIC